MKLLKTLSLSIIGLVSTGAMAQEFSSDIQIRPRYEYTNGFGTLLTPTTSHTSFVGQRTRINLNYGDEKLKVKVALQNVRTWGNVNTLGNISTDKNGVALYEGWAQYSFTNKWSTKIGRQLISYDNQRIIGGLDWANQGRSFDAALIKYKGDKSQLDLGFALNADSEGKVAPSTPFATDFKDMQYAWYHTSIKKLGVSLLALNLGREYQKAPLDIETNYSQTFGTYANYAGKKVTFDFSFYGQTGKIGINEVSAWETAANLGYAFSPKFKATLGYEFLSGKDQNSTSTVVKSFNPIVGTNHAFNGFMDYFFGGNHFNSVGLKDFYLKSNVKFNPKANLSVNLHGFASNAKLGIERIDNKAYSQYLGTEADLVFTYKMANVFTMQVGHSQMFATDSMKYLKNAADPASMQSWTWVGLNFRSQFKVK